MRVLPPALLNLPQAQLEGLESHLRRKRAARWALVSLSLRHSTFLRPRAAGMLLPSTLLLRVL